MSILDRWFRSREQTDDHPDIRFGRYSDSYKPAAAYDAWDQALEYFELGEYLDAYRAFFSYLRDDEEDNVRWWEQPDGITFELYQGSKRVTGVADARRLRVEARIAQMQEARPELLRRLVEQNYSLKYSRYALDPERHITVIFDTNTLDASPYKLYYALKEVATQADKQDDLLLEEFRQLESVDSSHLQPIPEAEKEVKCQFILSKVRAVLDEVEQGRLDKQQYPGGIAYLLLDLIYKIDYLTKPEGYTTEILERAHRQYFTKAEELTTTKKNELLSQELAQLLDRPREEFGREMYRVKATFGITVPVTHDRVVSIIDSELHNMDWYHDHGYSSVALAVPSYIIGYALFNYAIPQPDREFFHLFFRITEPDYFRQLGFSPDFYDTATQQFDRRAIRRAIEDIVDAYRPQYPRLRPAASRLRYQSLADFARSYLLMVRDLDLTKVV